MSTAVGCLRRLHITPLFLPHHISTPGVRLDSSSQTATTPVSAADVHDMAFTTYVRFQ